MHSALALRRAALNKKGALPRSGISMEESRDCWSTGQQQQPRLPPGFRFHPTDEELVVHYLKKKAVSAPLPVTIIADVDLYKFDPWELPQKANFGDHEWYFFSPRERKYPNGARPNRAATSGYWKATGTDKPILTSAGTHKVGVKKALVFYGGKPPRGVKTNWIMHEYRLAESPHPKKPSSSLRLDDWVLCRIYKKNASSSGSGGHQKQPQLPPFHPYPDPVLLDSAEETLFQELLASSETPAGSAASILSFLNLQIPHQMQHSFSLSDDINWSSKQSF